MRVQGDSPRSNATISIWNSLFEENFAPIGGGMYVTSGFRLSVEQTSFVNNSAYVWHGGGASLDSEGEVMFRECNFTGGWGSNGGGGEKEELIIKRR